MKDLKLIEMFKQGHMVIPLFLMQNYKKFNIKLDEFIFLMYLFFPILLILLVYISFNVFI